jgi:cytochrome c-L
MLIEYKYKQREADMRLTSALIVALMVTMGMTACGKGGSTGGSDQSAGADSGKMIEFVTTQDGTPMVIKAELFDTPQAKEFLSTGKNPYIGNQEAIDKGKKLFQMYSCTQCHGADAQGQTGPSLHGPTFHYAKNATNKGMFETIWHGTNGGMGAKGIGLMSPEDPTAGLKPDEVLKVQAWIRSHGTTTGNE